MYFKLNGLEYTVESCSVSFDIIPYNQHLKMYIAISARTENNQIDSELQYVRLYHNSGFDIGGKTIRNLKGKRFEWKKASNWNGGTLYVLEHEDVTSGIIEILDITADAIKIKWTGCGNVFWNNEYGKDVPFEAEIETALPAIPKYKVLNGMTASVFKLDKDTVLEFLNFDELLQECNRCVEMWRNDDREAWNKYQATLKMILHYKGVEYQGKAVYNGHATECETVFSDTCPVKITISKTYLDTNNGQYNFYVLMEK